LLYFVLKSGGGLCVGAGAAAAIATEALVAVAVDIHVGEVGGRAVEVYSAGRGGETVGEFWRAIFCVKEAAG
jgi:hypothetical protein